MAELFICPKGALTELTRIQLAKAGVIVIETNHPDRCKFIRANALVSGDAMLTAALKALTVSNNYGSGQEQRNKFIALLMEMVEATNPQRIGENE